VPDEEDQAEGLSGIAPIVLLEFMDLINDLGGAIYFSTQGLWQKRYEVMEAIITDPKGEEGTTYVTAGPPEEQPPRLYLMWNNRVLVDEKLGRDGAFAVQLSNSWIISLVAAWEYRFRQEIAALLKLPTRNDLTSDEMGDLTLMRNDIVHHHGVATTNNCGRCRSLRWFAEGETIRVDTPLIYEFHKKIGPQVAEWGKRAAELEWEAIGEVPPWKRDNT